jgi:thioredoxin-dependent peroxiredoxin
MQTGDVVEDFERPDETGTPRRLSEFLASGPVVLFFYPGAMTYGCTKESCHFRDLSAEFGALGAQLVGISGDPVEKQKQFSDKYHFDYPLLSDADGSVAKAFGVQRSIAALGIRRKTFVIDTDRTVLAVIASEVSFKSHADKALALLRARRTPQT